MVEYLLVSTLISTENTTTEPDQRSKKSSSYIWVFFQYEGQQTNNEVWVWSLFCSTEKKSALKSDWDTKYDLIFIGQMVVDYGRLFKEYGRNVLWIGGILEEGVLTLWRQTLFEIIIKQRRSRAIGGFWIGLEVGEKEIFWGLKRRLRRWGIKSGGGSYLDLVESDFSNPGRKLSFSSTFIVLHTECNIECGQPKTTNYRHRTK